MGLPDVAGWVTAKGRAVEERLRIDVRTMARWLGILALLAVVVPFVVYAVPGVVGAEHSFVVLSGSMEPKISPGDAVIVDETDPAAIEEGDVITFVRAEKSVPTTHRVVDVRQRGDQFAFETEGDANEGSDPELVPAANVVGTVSLTIPLIGHVIHFANTRVGFVVFLLVPLGGLALIEVWSLTRLYRKRIRSRDEPKEPATETTKATATAFESGEHETEIEDGDAEAVTLAPSDLRVATGLLALVAPYTVYVALQLRTALAISVAFASGFLLLAVGGLSLVDYLSMPYPPQERDESDQRVTDEKAGKKPAEPLYPPVSVPASGGSNADPSGGSDSRERGPEATGDEPTESGSKGEE